MRTLFVWLAVPFVLAVCGKFGSCADRPYTDRPHFIILDADPELATRIDSILTRVHGELSELSGIGILDTLTILVATRQEQFDSVVGGHFPDWGAGCALPERNTIVILSPRLFPFRVSVAEILRHEMAHIYLKKLVGGPRIPRWMHEGFAMQIGHQWVFADNWLVARAVFARETVPLERIEALNLYQEGKARLAYAQSYLAMKYFLEKYGWESFLLFLRETRRSNDWDQAFMAAVGLNYAGYQAEFATFMEGKYNWASLFSDTILMWILLVLLVLVLYLFKRQRTKKKEKEWERAESIEDIFYSAGDRPPEQTGRP